MEPFSVILSDCYLQVIHTLQEICPLPPSRFPLGSTTGALFAPNVVAGSVVSPAWDSLELTTGSEGNTTPSPRMNKCLSRKAQN